MVPTIGAWQFGRRAVPDTRDLHYLLADDKPWAVVQPPSRLVKVMRGPLYDQGDQPGGVACALLAQLHAAPRRIGPARTPDPGVLDTAGRALEGSHLERAEPVSLRAVCRALEHFGLVTSYHWTYDLDEIIAWLGSGHGITLGLDWYAAMSRPDETGLISSWGAPLGGHAVFAFGVDPVAQVVLIQNSWGPEWGGWETRPGRRDFKGCARLPYDDLRKLLADNGEGVVLEQVAE